MSALAERLREAFAAPSEPPLYHDVGPELMGTTEFVPAAVLVGVIDAPAPRLLLTVRHAGLRKHAGQVAFPGGRVDPEDAGPVAAALREAWEEVTLPTAVAQIVGTAEPYRTGTGYSITPVIAVLPDTLNLVPHEAEVSAIFEPPLAHMLDATNQDRKTLTVQGRERAFYEILWNEFRTWGVTAGLIVNLGNRLRAGLSA
ncbi:CoA pyrophosphatase [Sphingomonas montanisoli]|uniref:CoA pyrophosphatase n=1 Tax=Sphingomonas montanisoli TaxID=2606412 RepID=A0A5D9C7B2_9SPHN|nr:CoA pyrophosphatase [Sphingomonas montanisoli]TZG27758.1 CoA pyrophosphatase [Sphingomonas montanisoli]